MSYARFGPDSDVYAFPSSGGSYVCSGCYRGRQPGTSVWFETAAELLGHLEMHRAMGDKVPDYALDRLSREIHEEALAEEKPDSA